MYVNKAGHMNIPVLVCHLSEEVVCLKFIVVFYT